ncbi:PIN domain-containing protein, partial [Chryseobacterium sp.]|uniref:PIN domain-containing protein n=1 Tax=Chryseobacterium sp. TaxID=1871047 RepID=UPI00289B239F
MAKNILIDTNILKNLVSRTEFSPYLRQIHSWQEQGDITLYYPETLKTEWNKHREEELKKINGVIREHKKVVKLSGLFGKEPDIGEPELELADKRLQAQVFTIDQLLEDAVLITNEGKAASLMWEHRKQGKAPFRNKSKSENDAVILFAALEELSERGETELFFFSANHTDFAAPGNEEVIHADISARYPNIKVIYFCDLAAGMHALVGEGLSTTKKAAGTGKFLIAKVFPDDTGKPIAERLVSYINNRFSDISFLPKRLFSFHPPFVVGEEFTERKIPFVLNTDNKDVYNFFSDHGMLPALADKSTVGELGISEAELTDFLRSNLVHEISYQGEKPISLVHGQREECTCAVCVFRRLQFRKSFTLLKEIDLEPASLKKAYTFYLHGDYGKSISVLVQVAEEAENERRWITYYIAKYNLLLLGRSLLHRKTSEDLPEALLSGYRNLNLDEILMVCRKASINDILDHLHYGNFMDYASDRMKPLSAKLKDYNTDQMQGYINDTE